MAKRRAEEEKKKNLYSFIEPGVIVEAYMRDR